MISFSFKTLAVTDMSMPLNTSLLVNWLWWGDEKWTERLGSYHLLIYVV